MVDTPAPASNNRLNFAARLLQMAEGEAAGNQALLSQKVLDVLNHPEKYETMQGALAAFNDAMDQYARATYKASQISLLVKRYTLGLAAQKKATEEVKENAPLPVKGGTQASTTEELP